MNKTDDEIGLDADVNVTPQAFDPALDPDLDRFSRRTLLGRAGASAVGVVAAGMAVASDAQETPKKQRALDDSTLKKTELTRKVTETQDGDTHVEVYFKGFQVDPSGDQKRAGVIVIHEIFGLTDHIKDVACRFAQAGYTALAPNLFTREGEPPASAAGFQPLMEFVSRVPDHQIISDLKSAISYLKMLPTSNGKVGAVGFCWGGRIVMLLDAEAPELDAAVAYYGRIAGTPTANQPASPLDLVEKMHAPLLGNFGAEDQGIKPSDVEKLRAAMKEHHKTAELYEYEHAGHAFNNDTRESYRPEAARLAFHRTLEWFKKYLS